MNIYTPYTYLIGWSKYDKWYYGVRYAKNCSPTELFETYFTSSKQVKMFYEIHVFPDVIEIRKTFKTSDEARFWEQKVLKRLNVTSEEKWLNKTDNISITESSALSGSKKPKSESFKEKLRIHRTGKKHSEETKNKIRLKALGRPGYWKNKNISEETKKKLSEIGKSLTGEKNPFYGKSHSQETKDKISAKKRKL